MLLIQLSSHSRSNNNRFCSHLSPYTHSLTRLQTWLQTTDKVAQTYWLTLIPPQTHNQAAIYTHFLSSLIDVTRQLVYSLPKRAWRALAQMPTHSFTDTKVKHNFTDNLHMPLLPRTNPHRFTNPILHNSTIFPGSTRCTLHIDSREHSPTIIIICEHMHTQSDTHTPMPVTKTPHSLIQAIPYTRTQTGTKIYEHVLYHTSWGTLNSLQPCPNIHVHGYKQTFKNTVL